MIFLFIIENKDKHIQTAHKMLLGFKYFSFHLQTENRKHRF